jgi:hypothetical protein
MAAPETAAEMVVVAAAVGATVTTVLRGEFLAAMFLRATNTAVQDTAAVAWHKGRVREMVGAITTATLAAALRQATPGATATMLAASVAAAINS